MRTKFEAGSLPWEGGFVRAVARYTEAGGAWQRELVLIQNARMHRSGEEAAMLAKLDLDRALAEATGRGMTMDHYLSAIGYTRLEESQ